MAVKFLTDKSKVSALDNDKGYLDTSTLSEAVNSALAQAKESGEFDGEDGKTPVNGTDYYTDAEKAQMISDVTDGLPKITLVGTDVNGTTHTWTLYGVAN